MSRREKLIESIRNNPKDVDFNDLRSLLLYFGCKERTRGSHYIFSHQSVSWRLTIPKERPVKAPYARQAVRMVDEMKEAMQDE